jgi:hypothetical protein
MRNASRKGMRFFATLTAARMNDMAGAPAASTTGGMRASSRHKTTPHLDLTPMPTGTVSTGYNADGTMFVQVIATGGQIWILDDGTNTSPEAKSSPVRSGNSGPYPLHAFETGVTTPCRRPAGT